MTMDVLLAVVPFADVERPAIGVSLLKAEVARAGFSCAVEYLNFGLAETIGHELYTAISESIPSESLVGDWFFADVLFGDDIPPAQDYVDKILRRLAGPSIINAIQQARPVRHQFVEQAAQRLHARRARVVGFTTTFHQTCCSVAIARRLKQLPDPPVIVFGGANCEGEMGLQLLRAFPEIDYVCTREGDIAFPLFLQRLLRDGDPSAVPGILHQGESKAVTLPELVTNLDALPIPDYDDYMSRLLVSPLHGTIAPELLIETSRGCWWGAKQHCTFCGLNGDTMGYRSKSPDRAFDELSFLSTTYGVRKIDCVDNILDLRYVPTLFPRLAASDLDLELFYEVKANLRQDQIAALRAGGVRTIQPGIESFSNEILRRMRKGCTGLQNIQLLRWCEEAGIAVAWNILAGFPGEAPDEYAAMARLLPLLVHLPPPSSCAPIRLDRFSPLFVGAEAFSLRRVRPTSAYYYVYPLGRRELSRLAYFFDFDYGDDRHPADYIGDLRREVEHWLLARSVEETERPRLDATIEADGSVTIADTRPCAVQPVHQLTGLDAEIYLACDSAQGIASLSARFEAVEPALARLTRDGLMVEMEGRVLSLAVLRNRSALSPGVSDAHVRVSAPKTGEPLLRAG
jgi:ribosomal peptide maturation radical SAM protein 1